MGRPIDEEDAINAILREYNKDDSDYPTDYQQGLSAAKKIIEQLPSAQSEPSTEIQEILNYLDTTLHPIVSPDNWDVYAELYDMVSRLLSVQPEPIRINLNEPIKVKLTDWGKEIYYHQYDRTNQIAGREICKPKFPKEDENGYTEFQLWCFIELYGIHMGMTLPNVIDPLEIVYER